MTELGCAILKESFSQSLVKLCIRYVDNTLLLVKRKGIYSIKNHPNSLDKNYQIYRYGNRQKQNKYLL